MYGALLGDYIGSPYEFDMGDKTKDFTLFNRYANFTDDSVMTIAVAEALMDSKGKTDAQVKKALVRSMQDWGRFFPAAGYGGRFYNWLYEKNPKPYGSYGNGSAMRVSSAGWLYDTLEETRKYARLSAEVTHNHPEGIKGAEATASAIFLARTGHSKDEIREYVISRFGYNLSRTCDEIRPTYHHMESCQETVPEAITAFLEGEDFEDVIRTAVSLGGDCDTLTCIAGSMAEAFYGVPEEMKQKCRDELPEEMLRVLYRFEEERKPATQVNEVAFMDDPFLSGNEMIEYMISRYHADSTKENLIGVLEMIRNRMHRDGHFLFPVEESEMDGPGFHFRTVQLNDNQICVAAFTSREELEKGAKTEVVSFFIDAFLKDCLDMEAAEGIIINPWGEAFLLTKELIKMIFQADGDEEYIVPDVPLTKELLEDGSFLKKALEINGRNGTWTNTMKVFQILRESDVWVPCNAIPGEENQRLVPDILQNGEDYFLPVFTSEEEMGEYGNGFSHIQLSFLDVISLARNNEKDLKGIVINAFSDPFEIYEGSYDMIEEIESGLEKEE